MERAAIAQDDDGVVDVLRGRALEIVDESGEIRASITIHGPEVLDDGSTYPETVLLRLTNEIGRPVVKMQASTDGGGLGLFGEDDPAAIVLMSRGTEPTVVVRDIDGTERTIGAAD
jgi:hypothetical protein